LSSSANVILVDNKKEVHINKSISLAAKTNETTFIVKMEDIKYIRNSLESLLTKIDYISDAKS
jgi:hypothetical protein